MDETDKLDNLVKKANRNLLEISTVFPFDLFPNTIRVDENKVDIVYRNSFFDKHVVSILIKNINSVTISTGVLFATINFEVSGFVTGYEVKPTPIPYFKKKDAVHLKRVVMGLIAAHSEGVDLAKVPSRDIESKIEQIGKSNEFPKI
jgi:hypothetical protein